MLSPPALPGYDSIPSVSGASASVSLVRWQHRQLSQTGGTGVSLILGCEPSPLVTNVARVCCVVRFQDIGTFYAVQKMREIVGHATPIQRVRCFQVRHTPSHHAVVCSLCSVVHRPSSVVCSPHSTAWILPAHAPDVAIGLRTILWWWWWFLDTGNANWWEGWWVQWGFTASESLHVVHAGPQACPCLGLSGLVCVAATPSRNWQCFSGGSP